MSPTIEDILQEHFGMSRLELELVICARNFYLRNGIGSLTWKLEFNCLERVYVCLNKTAQVGYRCCLRVEKRYPGFTTEAGTEFLYYPIVKSIFKQRFCRMAKCTLEL